MTITKAHKRQIVATYGYPYFVGDTKKLQTRLECPLSYPKKIRRKIGRKIRKLGRDK